MLELVQKHMKWLLLPRDFETVRRSVLRKLKWRLGESSKPVISGDTFMHECDFAVTGHIEAGVQTFQRFQDLNGRLFVQAEPDSNATRILLDACNQGLTFPGICLVIHNGDDIPNELEMELLCKSFKSVYSVNWLGDLGIAKPLPIGLENVGKLRNGVPSDYLNLVKRGLPPLESRDIELLVCFSIWTNPSERSQALLWSQKVPGVLIVNRPITPRKYRKLLLRSKYVLSPPGNGPDCHRTWEALYLGATPVVHRAHWPFQDYDIPVLTLESWPELSHRLSSPGITDTNSWKEVSNWLA